MYMHDGHVLSDMMMDENRKKIGTVLLGPFIFYSAYHCKTNHRRHFKWDKLPRYPSP